MIDFVHLHVHSHYSLLDGVPSVGALVAAAVEQGMPALALTDHGTMAGVVEFYKEARARKVKPIIGLEAWVAARGRSYRGDLEKCFHLVLLARDRTGYQNLMRLSSFGYLEGFHYKPRIDRELLAQCGRGLIGMSACVGGEISQALLAGKVERAREALAFYRSVFGKEHFYLELQDHGTEEERVVNPRLVELARAEGAPLVATNDVHYLRKQDALAQDVLTCIGSGKRLADKERFRYPSDAFYFRSADEMRALFKHVPEALTNTVRVAEACNLELELGKAHWPGFEVGPGETADGMLERLCREALPRRYREVTAEVEERLATELATVRGMGFSDYFLIVGDCVAFARAQGIAVGPGRGASAGSLVSYLLGITGLDPMAHGLYFERFLNPERATVPDIDLDFCFERRDEVSAYVRSKYRPDRVGQVGTFGRLPCRATLKGVARVLEIPFWDVKGVANAVPDVNHIHYRLEDALQDSEQLRGWADTYPQLFEVARTVEGVPRKVGVHWAGVVIAPDTLYEFVPLAVKNGVVRTQFDLRYVEEIGLLKMDFLGLKTLTLIQRTVARVGRRSGEALDIDGIPQDDRRTFELLCDGDTAGVFQFESSGFTDLLRKVHPTRFADLVAVIALYRPGPRGSGMLDEFLETRHGRRAVDAEPHLRVPLPAPPAHRGGTGRRVAARTQGTGGASPD